MNQNHYKREDCRLCNSKDLELVFSLESTPPANEFLKKEELNEEQEKYPLDIYFCSKCFHVQLLDVVNPEILFRNYVYVSGTSPVFVKHFNDYADKILNSFDFGKNPFVIDIGSNDGTLLRAFKERDCTVLGIDPAKEIVKAANENGINTICDFFSPKLSETIKQDHGKADIVVANNVFAHVDDLRGFATGIRELLSESGVFVFEVSYLLDVYEKTLFDTIYHEHLDYHSVKPLKSFFDSLGMELTRVERIGSHGGSLRGYAQLKREELRVEKSVNELIELESEKGLYKPETFKVFAKNINNLGEELNALLKDLNSKGKKIAAYGAPAKATTLMHHFKIGPELVDFIIDDSPLKQGRFSPGYHIPVVSSSELYNQKPDYTVILAWNFADPIIKNHKKYSDEGGKFIVPLPELGVN